MTIELVCVFAGFLCGFFNTVASSGSAVTLPLLVFLGVPPAIANGTNRLPVVLAALVATYAFIKAGKIRWAIALKLSIPPMVGCLIGAEIADHIDPSKLHGVIAIAVVVALVLLFTRIKTALQSTLNEPERYRFLDGLYLLLVGVWMGLIVLDGATYLLMVLILSMRMQLLVANAYKNLILVVVSGMSLVVFAIDGNVDWRLGALLALGSLIGGYVGARFAMHELAKKWTYRFLVGIIVLELIHMAVMYVTGDMIN
ncbi:MAG: hypothetical protein RL651_1161 [Pseudomonadota bacterium]|jgi:uncharacterized membrane protein YfcA